MIILAYGNKYYLCYNFYTFTDFYGKAPYFSYLVITHL